MKKAIKINLGGLIFHIDEDAYDRLKQYISALMSQFGNNAEAREIVSDIESRIAELFQERLNAGKQVINLSDVEEVISIMGKPNEYDTEPSQAEEAEYSQEYDRTISKRRFYRDIDNSVLGGVCSGLGAYFGIDPVIFRILFVIFLFIWGAALPIYIILWIALPAARTAAQKLEMHGEPVNISNIEKKVKEEYEQVKKNFKRIDPEKKARNFFESFLHIIVTILKGIFKIIAVIIGGVFIITGIVFIAVFMALLFGKPELSGIPFSDFNFMLGQFIGTGMHGLALALVIIMCAIPVLAVLYLGLKLIFKFKTIDRYFWISATVLWIGSIVAFVILTVSVVKDVSEDSFKTTSFEIETTTHPHITLIANSQQNLKQAHSFFSNDEEDEYLVDDNDNIFGRAHLIIEKSMDSTANVVIERKSRGSSYNNANENAQAIQYDVFQRDSLIVIDPYFMLKPNSKWRAQELKVTIYIPKGIKISIDKNLEDILKDANVDGTYWMHELPGKSWIMTDKGLSELK